MVEKVLITGASGLIGQRLTSLLLKEGVDCNLLGREGKSNLKDKRVKAFKWDIDTGEMDERAFEGVTAIIHLAGAGVADKRWTESRKKEIVESRVKSADLIYRFLKKGNHQVKTFISASAVGYYGDCGAELVSENHKPANTFLADVCKKWEQGAVKIGRLGIREVRCRIGIVLAEKGGALPELVKTIPLGVAGYFAKDNLYYPWIHIDDVCGIMIHALENPKLNGPYNTTAPGPILLKVLMQHILKVKKSSAILVPAPPFALKLAMGEMSEMLLSSQNCSDKKILDAGYRFKYADIDEALKDALGV